MKTTFIPIDYDYFDCDGQDLMKIYGRDDKNRKICLIDSTKPYLWVILKKDLSKNKIQKLIREIESLERVKRVNLKEKKFLGKNVTALQIFSNNHKDLKLIKERVVIPEIQKRRGYDINVITSYIIEKELNPLTWYEIEGEILHNSNEFGGIDNIIETDFVIKLEKKIEIKKEDFKINSLAYDIETDSLKPEKGEILMVSLFGEKFKKVISWKKEKTKFGWVEFVKDEKELIKRFIELVKEKSPDFLVGYNSDSFDLNFFKTRAKILKIPFTLGLDSSEPRISRGKTRTAKISGITHIDLLRFIKTAYGQYMKSETLSLNEVSKEFLGDKKTEFKIKHSSKLKFGEWEKYYKYNLQDSVLTYELFKKFIPDMIEFSKIIKEPIFDISRNGLSKQIESYILHNLNQFNEIPEKRPTEKEVSARISAGPSEGAFVYEPKPGLYEDIVMFDFTSMHTSIIISHNISKETLTNSKENSIESPEIIVDGKKIKYYFTKEKGFFPELMKEIFDARKKAKTEYNKNPNPITKARSNAFKVLSASAHGYIAFSGGRYYSREASRTILAFVRKYNLDTIKKIENAGHKIIMGDTDSVAFTREGKTKNDIKKILKKINDQLPGVMHLELENFFKRGIFVTTRSGETGAKKKYAMIDEDGNIKIRGFETVRRDWCPLARKTQNKVIRLILKDGTPDRALKYTKEIIEKLKSRKIKIEELKIKSQIKKPLKEYKSISPHVVAAQKLKEKGESIEPGTIVEYYMAEKKGNSKLVRDKVKLIDEPGVYEIEYYLKKQILPSVENIFQVFGIEVSDIIEGSKQEGLKKWF